MFNSSQIKGLSDLSGSIFLILATIFFLFSGSLPLHAETLYVKPSAEIVVRTGQGTSYKIVGMVKDGDSVELLEEENSYAKVRLKNNVEGWMVRRFLGSDPPLKNVVETLTKENSAIKEKSSYTEQNLVEVSATLEQTKNQYSALSEEHNQLKTEYNTLLADTADVINIKKAQQLSAEKNKELQEQLLLTIQENKELKSNETKRWFLTGAGVLLLGILLGKLPGPSRKRKSSLLQ